MACKPDSVTTLKSPTTIPLGPPSPTGSCSQPGPLGREKPWGRAPRGPYSALLLAGLAVPPTLPPARWALTPPFHPCRRAEASGGLLSVALSLGSPRAGVTRRHLSLESGLSSSPAAAAVRPSARAPLYVGSRAPVNARPASGRRHVGRLGLGGGRPGAPAQARGREHRRPVVRRARHSRRPRPRRRRLGQPARGPAPPSAQTARPPRARRRQSNFGPGVGLAAGRHVGMGDDAGGRDRPAGEDAVEQALERRHLRLGERREAGERAGVGELDADRARVDVAPARPRAGAGVPGARRLVDQRARPGRPRRSDSAPRPPRPGRRAGRARPRRVAIAV